MRTINELFKSDEPLLDDLLPYIIETGLGPWVKHPLVIMPLIKPALINEKYVQLTRYVREQPYELEIYERPFSLDKLVEWWRGGELPNDQLVEMMAWAWPDTENDDTLQDDLIANHILPMFVDLGYVSDDDELVPPEAPLTIYRGGEPDSIAWSESLDTAKWFAARFRPHQNVWRATAHPDVILARFHGRGEREVVVDPRNLEDVQLLIYATYQSRSDAREELVDMVNNIENRG